MDFLERSVRFISTDSLCSTIVALYTVLFIYFPFLVFIQFVFSPVVLTTLILLLYLLRLGAAQSRISEISDFEPPLSSGAAQLSPEQIPDHHPDCDNCSRIQPVMEIGPCSGSIPDPEPFVEWDVRAPLEVIYEEYDEGDDGDAEETRESERNIIQKYATLSLFFPESDGDSSSEGDFPESGYSYSPESGCFRWEKEDDEAAEGLIEIELDGKSRMDGDVADEENLIEIDLSPAV
ncbi:uncharacterized protein LOC127247853 [Andrographis paniculata]|uniref:uncharacterized protein LOC127247853 n=1 Tax=Andrographis paniculata TaxID=175694 RepID=UPI0021E88EBD|nr:uncharacterized protein LOC127247853 [Andrographis paniculata]